MWSLTLIKTDNKTHFQGRCVPVQKTQSITDLYFLWPPFKCRFLPTAGNFSILSNAEPKKLNRFFRGKAQTFQMLEFPSTADSG